MGLHHFRSCTLIGVLSSIFILSFSALGEDLPEFKEFTVDKPGYFIRRAPAVSVDPVQGLTEEEVVRIEGGLDDPLVKELLNAYVDRIEETYTGRVKAPEGFVYWLGENPEIRKTFWLALSPYYDDLSGAMGVLNSLRMEDADLVTLYYHLAVALAVVWDTENAVYGSRYICINGIKKDQYPPLPDALKVFRYFTDKKRLKKFLFKPEKMVWPILVHLAEWDVSEEEGDWALYHFGKSKTDLAKLYSMVEYDNSKVNSEQGNLGARKYILPNILEYGGICGDQAHFCSRTAKCLGVPAMKASGLSRYGGAGHAFTLFFVWKKGRLHLESTGRYYFDYYYTGNVFDPQTRTEILDRHLGLILDGASLSYNKFITAHALSRIASKVYSNHTDVSVVLVKKALALNWFCGAGWKLLMRHIEDGHMEPREGTQWANKMMKYVKDHPDLTLNCFTTFLGCIPREDTKKRQSFYQQAFKSYKKRPDLQIDLRIAQGKELIGSGEEETALAIFLDTAAEHAKTGRIMLPLLEEAVKIVNEKNEYHLAFQAFDKILKKYPRKRGASIAKSFQDLARLLIPVYKAGDREKDAYFLRMEAELYD